MRGVFTVLVLGALTLGLLAWFALPAVAAGLAISGLATAGFDPARTTVEVEADPPPRLLSGRADRVRVRSTGVRLAGVTVERVDLRLTDVGIVDRTFATVEGELVDVRLEQADGSHITVPTITLHGPSDRTEASFRFPADTAAALVRDAVERRLGQPAAAVALEAPDRVRVEVGGRSIGGRLEPGPGGGLVVRPDGGAPAFTVVDPVARFTLTSVSVEGGSLVAAGTVDLEALLR